MSRMAQSSADVSPYLRRPLYLYDLPPELLATLTLHASSSKVTTQSRPNSERDGALQDRKLDEDGIAHSTACSLCQITFRDVSDQRQHVRSDFHKYNLKLQMRGNRPVSEAVFAQQIGDLDESLSGSDSSETDSEEDANQNGDVKLSALLKRQAKLSQQDDQDDGETTGKKRKRGPGNAPMYWLTSPKLPDDHGLGIYKALFTNEEQDSAQSTLLDVLKRKQLQPTTGKSGDAGKNGAGSKNDPHFFLCMIGGGHFAAAVIALTPEVRKGAGGVEERHAIVKAHKTFHRYTTRRKQGGSQSANDNAKGNAHSVGSAMRRANEAALVVDIRNLLAEWKSMIDTSELIFIRATGSQNRHTLFGPYEGQVMTSRDKRIRGFPFSTRRATQNELIRAFQELTRVKVEKLVEEEIIQTPVDNSTKQATKPKEEKPKLTPAEEEDQLHTTQLQALIRRSKAPGVLLYLTKNNINLQTFRFFPSSDPSNHHAPTPLHLAASLNSPAVVQALLTKSSADPTITNADGKTPYDISGDSRTRDSFRISRFILGDSSHDWAAAHVPSALDPAKLEAEARAQSEKQSAAEAERRMADLAKIRMDEEARKIGKIENKHGSGKTLTEKTWSEKQEEDQRGLTPEMKMRLERERRARAAEARFAKK